MDDPWGSPWAAAENSATAAPLPPLPVVSSDAADGPQLPPPARTSIPFLSLPSLAEPSPWADDTGASVGAGAEGIGGYSSLRGATDDFDDSAFGDWAAATPGSLDNGLSPFPSTKTRNNNTTFFSGDASPIAWPSPTASRSPSRAPSRSPATSISARRAPSIEPRRDELIEPTWERPRAPSPGTVRRLSRSPIVDDSHTDHAAEEDDEHDEHDEHGKREAVGGADADGDDADDTAEGDSPITPADEGTLGASLPRHTKEKDVPRGLELRLPLQRKVSNKVQDLVVHFDGLAVTTPAPTSRRPSPSPSRIARGVTKDDVENENYDEDDADDDDFADFEGPSPDGPVVDEARPRTPEQRPEGQKLIAAAGEEAARTTPAPSPSAASVPTQTPSPVHRGRPGAATQPPSLSIAELLDHYGPVAPYTPPQAELDALFAAEEQLLGLPAGGGDQQPRPQPQPQPNDDVPVLDAYVPDHVLTDSFTAISERRVWYRIARAGSSRRNRADIDDDNYRPVTWATSTAVRPDTLRIVRRWVEEDAFTGRATLGGGRGGRVFSGSGGSGGSGPDASSGSAGSSAGGIGPSSRGHLFGWDSTAAPLALDSVYRKKRPKARPVSMGSNTMTAAAGPATRHSVHFTGAQRLGLGLGLGLPRPLSLSPASTPDSSSASEWAQPALHGGGKNLVAAVSPVAVPPAVEDDDDDDGDWGEMVSSPAAGAGFFGAGSAPAAALANPLSSTAGTPPPVTTAHEPPQPSAIPTPVLAQQQPMFTVGADVERAVEVILQGLPDLSYMTK